MQQAFHYKNFVHCRPKSCKHTSSTRSSQLSA